MRYALIDDKVLCTQRIAASLVDLAVKRGAHVERLLRGTRLFQKDLLSSTHRMSPEQLFKLIDNCEQQTHASDLGFLLGRRIISQYDNCFDKLLAQPKDLHQAIQLWACYFERQFPLVSLRMRGNTQRKQLVLRAAFLPDSQARFVFEVVTAAFQTYLKRTFNTPCTLHYELSYPEPVNAKHYYQVLGSHTQFDRGTCQIAIPQAALRQPAAENNAFLRKSLLAECRQTRKRQIQQPSLLLCLDTLFKQDNQASLETCADALQLSPATLKRRLKQHKTTFQKQQDQYRMGEALHALRNLDNNNSALASMLGFTNTANFRRAFKRWTGKTPSEMKALDA